jgi:sirohydrochlorin ferrochelatase
VQAVNIAKSEHKAVLDQIKEDSAAALDAAATVQQQAAAARTAATSDAQAASDAEVAAIKAQFAASTAAKKVELEAANTVALAALKAELERLQAEESATYNGKLAEAESAAAARAGIAEEIAAEREQLEDAMKDAFAARKRDEEKVGRVPCL